MFKKKPKEHFIERMDLQKVLGNKKANFDIIVCISSSRKENITSSGFHASILCLWVCEHFHNLCAQADGFLVA